MRHHGRDLGAPRKVRHAETVVRAQEQRAPVGQRVRPGVLIAGAGVEPEEEQVRREQRVEPADRAPLLGTRDRFALRGDLLDIGAIRSGGAVRVGGLVRPVIEAVRGRGPRPELEDGPEPAFVVGRVDEPRGHEHLAPDQREVRNRPHVHRIDLGGEPVPGAPQLLGRHDAVDLVDDLGITPVALHAGDEDVRGHRYQRRLERRALRRQDIGDLGLIPEPPFDLGAFERHEKVRTTPGSAEQSTSTGSPSPGSVANTVAITQGTWYSRLTMPMCDCGVPDRHTTAVSSSKMGARNVAPASATQATTPSAVESMSSSTSSGDDRRRQEPRTGPAANTRVPLPKSVTVIECSRIAAVTISA